MAKKRQTFERAARKRKAARRAKAAERRQAAEEKQPPAPSPSTPRKRAPKKAEAVE